MGRVYYAITLLISIGFGLVYSQNELPPCNCSDIYPYQFNASDHIVWPPAPCRIDYNVTCNVGFNPRQAGTVIYAFANYSNILFKETVTYKIGNSGYMVKIFEYPGDTNNTILDITPQARLMQFEITGINPNVSGVMTLTGNDLTVPAPWSKILYQGMSDIFYTNDYFGDVSVAYKSESDDKRFVVFAVFYDRLSSKDWDRDRLMLFNKDTSKLIDSGYPIYEMENGVVTIDNTAEIILYYAFRPEYEAVVLIYVPAMGMKIQNYKGASTQEVVHLNGTDEFKAQVILRNTKVSTWISKIDYFEYNDTLIYIYNGVKEINYTGVLPEDGLELIISKENSSNAIGYKLVNPVYTFVITRGYVIVIFANSDDPSSTAKPTTPHSVPTTAQATSTTRIFESTTSALYRHCDCSKNYTLQIHNGTSIIWPEEPCLLPPNRTCTINISPAENRVIIHPSVKFSNAHVKERIVYRPYNNPDEQYTKFLEFNKSSDGKTIDLIPASQILSFDVTSFDNVNPGNVTFIILGKAVEAPNRENTTIYVGPSQSILNTFFKDDEEFFEIASMTNQVVFFNVFYDTEREENERDRIMYYDHEYNFIDSGYSISKYDNNILTFDMSIVKIFYAYKKNQKLNYEIGAFVPAEGLKIDNYQCGGTDSPINLNATNDFAAKVIINKAVSIFNPPPPYAISGFDFHNSSDTQIYIYNRIVEVVESSSLPNYSLVLVINQQNRTSAIGFPLTSDSYTFVAVNGHVKIFLEQQSITTTPKPTTSHGSTISLPYKVCNCSDDWDFQLHNGSKVIWPLEPCLIPPDRACSVNFNPIDDGVIIYVTMSYDNIYAMETVIYELYSNPDEFVFKETEYYNSTYGQVIEVVPQSRLISFEVNPFDRKNPGNVTFTAEGRMASAKNRKNITITDGPSTSIFNTQFLDSDCICDITSLKNEILLFHAFYDTDRTEDERDRIMYFDTKNKLVDSGWSIAEEEGGVIGLAKTQVRLYYAYKANFTALVAIYVPGNGMRLQNYRSGGANEPIELYAVDDFAAKIIISKQPQYSMNSIPPYVIAGFDFHDSKDTQIYVYNDIVEVVINTAMPANKLVLVINQQNYTNSIGYALNNDCIYTFVAIYGHVSILLEEQANSTISTTIVPTQQTTSTPQSSTIEFISTSTKSSPFRKYNNALILLLFSIIIKLLAL